MSAAASHRSLKLTAVFLAVWATLCLADEFDPGVTSRHSELLVQRMHEKNLSGDLLKEKLNKTRIPDQEGTFPTLFWSSLGYSVTDISVNRYAEPKLNVSIEPNNHILQVEVPEIVLNCKYNVELKTGNWSCGKVSGKLSISITGVKLTMSREVVITNENKEKVKYISRDCTADIEYLELYSDNPEFKGISGIIDEKGLKNQVAVLLCNGSANLTEIMVSFEQDKSKAIYLDMTVVHQPIIGDKCIDFPLRGEFRPQNDTKPYTSWPEKISPQDTTDATFALGISNWTLDSLCDVIQDTNMLNYTYTMDDLPDKCKQLLNTTCVGDCIGNDIPKLSNLYPNMVVEMAVSTPKKPIVQMSPEKITMYIIFIVEAYVRKSRDSTEKIFTLVTEISAKLGPTVKGNKLGLAIERPVNSTLTVRDSKIGPLPNEPLTTVMGQSLRKGVVPLIVTLKDGFEIKSISYLPVTDSKYVTTDQALWFLKN